MTLHKNIKNIRNIWNFFLFFAGFSTLAIFATQGTDILLAIKICFTLTFIFYTLYQVMMMKLLESFVAIPVAGLLTYILVEVLKII